MRRRASVPEIVLSALGSLGEMGLRKARRPDLKRMAAGVVMAEP
jgi:hypothetical protein